MSVDETKIVDQKRAGAVGARVGKVRISRHPFLELFFSMNEQFPILQKGMKRAPIDVLDTRIIGVRQSYRPARAASAATLAVVSDAFRDEKRCLGGRIAVVPCLRRGGVWRSYRCLLLLFDHDGVFKTSISVRNTNASR